MVHSACLTSLARTYYTWRIVESLDKSYLFVPFGQWGGAELAAGIVLGCLPVFPRFFQHVGPNIHEVCIRFNGYFTKFKTRSTASESGIDSYSCLHGESCTPRELKGPRLQVKEPAAARSATKRDDLEYGHLEL